MFPLYLKRSDDDEKPTEPIAYIVGQNGTFLQKTTAIFRATIRADKLPMLAEVKESAEYLLPPIPAVLVAQILLFFKAIWERDKSEAIILIAYNPDNGDFGLVAPDQKASGAHVKYDMPQSAPPGLRFIGTIHSHGSMGAFHSGTDTHDEAHFDGIHLTVGYLDRSRVAVVAALAVNGRRQTLTPERVLEGLRFEKWTPKPPEPVVERPAEKEVEGRFPTFDSILAYFGQALSRRQLKKLKHDIAVEAKRAEVKTASTVKPYRSMNSGWQGWDEGYVLDLPPDVTWEEILPPDEWNARVEKPAPRVYTSTRSLGYGDETGSQPIGFHIQGPRLDPRDTPRTAAAAWPTPQPHVFLHESYRAQERASMPARHITPVPVPAGMADPHADTNPYTVDSGETSVPVGVAASKDPKEVPVIVTTDYHWHDGHDREGGES